MSQQSSAEFPELESELRLESEANLIRIITQHGSKGLEYPIVFVPFASRYKDPLKFGSRNLSLIEYHDQQGQLVLSLSGSKQAKQAMKDEAHGGNRSFALRCRYPRRAAMLYFKHCI